MLGLGFGLGLGLGLGLRLGLGLGLRLGEALRGKAAERGSQGRTPMCELERGTLPIHRILIFPDPSAWPHSLHNLTT